MKFLGAAFGWNPKEDTVYAPHDSARQKVVGQKEYRITRVITRQVRIVIDDKEYYGSFMIHNGTCEIRIMAATKRRFRAPSSNIKFRRDVEKSKAESTIYGQKYMYPVVSVTYIAVVIDSSKLINAEMDFTGLSNTGIMRELYKVGLIKSKEPSFLYENALGHTHVDFSRVEGMLLGIAIGDSLGNTTESIDTPGKRNAKYGLITDYLPNKRAHYRKVGLPSDDTQLAYDALEVILRSGKLDMRSLARTFASHRIFGIGGTVKQFLKNYKDLGESWYEAGVINGRGNGALMRIEPVIISSLRNPNENLLADTVLATMLTHNDALAIGSSVAFVNMLVRFLQSENPPKNEAWLDDFIRLLEAFTGDNKYKIRSEKAASKFPQDAPHYINEAIQFGYRNGLSVSEFGEYFGSGGYLLETDVTSLYILSRYIDNPREAIIQAVNFTKDNDTVASIVGASVGALYGRGAFDKKWIENLLGRTRENDDGKVFELIKETEAFLSGT